MSPVLPAVEPLGPRLRWFLVAVTLLAAALRLVGLGEWSLWLDEAHTWRDATIPLGGEHGFLRQDRVLYPLTFLLLRGLFGLGLLSYDEASLRLPFAIVGIVTVPVLALSGRRLIGNGPAVLAAALLAVHPWHIFWSQNARGYGVAMLASILATERAHRWLGSDRPRDLILAVLWLVLGALSHPTAVALVAGFFAYLFVRRRFDRRRSLGSWLAVALALGFLVFGVPWLIDYYEPFPGFQRAKADPSLLHFASTSLYYFRPPALLFAAIGLGLSVPMLGRQRALLLGCLVLVPMLVLAGVGAQLLKVTARYAICTLPLILWLGGFACWQVGVLLLRVRGGRATLRWALAALLPLLLLGDELREDVAYYGVQRGQRARWREAVTFLQQAAGQRPLRVLTVNQPTALYYLRRRHWFYGEGDPHPNVRVVPLERWMVKEGLDENKVRVTGPGVESHFQWHARESKARGALFAVMVTLPELLEVDQAPAIEGGIRAMLERDFELALFLPCWVGPKDESIYVYVPR